MADPFADEGWAAAQAEASRPLVANGSAPATPGGVRSFFTLGVGLVFIAIGISAFVSDISVFFFREVGSIAALVAGWVLLVAMISTARQNRSASSS